MENATVVPRLPLSEGEIFFPSPMMVMPARPGTPGSVRLTSSVSLTSRLPHDLTRLSATSLITLQLAERVPLRTFYDGLFRFPCHYGIQLYRKAAEIFDRLHEYQPGSKCNLFVESIEFSCNEEKKLAFELAYAAMKYEEVLRQTLDDVGFVVKYPEFQDELSLASVILYDYQDRRFQRRQALPSDRQYPRHCQLEEALFHLRTRLSAALARIRILHDAPTLQTLLPAEVHPPEPARHRPVHAWINCNKASSQQILDSLGSTLKILQPGLTESSFHYDDDFPDLLVFESGWKKTLEKTATFKKHWIVLQEKACCLPAYATAQELRRLRQREPELRGSVLQVGAGSGRSLAHLLSLLPDRDNISRLLAMSGDRKAVVERQLQELGVADARVMSGGLETHGRAAELRDVVAVLVTPVTTHTALADPVDWVMEEGGDIALLRELSMDPTKSALPQRVSALVTSQNETLLRALRLPNVRVVVYATHSSNRAENEEVVFGVVDEVNEEQRRRWQEAREHGKLEIETPPDKLYEFRQLVNIPEEDIAIPFLVLPQTPTTALSDSDGGGSSVGGGGIVQGVIFSSGSGAPSRAGSGSGGTYHTDTVRDLRELERVRQDAQVWWSRQAGRRSVMSPRSAGLRPHVRQLLASRGRAAARFGAAEPAVAVTGAGRRRRQASQPPEPSEHGDTEPSPLSLPKLASRTRHLSLGPPLNIHKVNIGDFSSVAVHIPPVF
ncbi:putative methyltransferase NSUN7 [Amphibalanus amphitrite]|uniref:Putative methyltransferase NSUN7 n=1 Tax=Amphibalanus amphitrite TaxID=1232801 RepID=A0A6A4X336_AMPAM|nr:putative methyltransferase NSUN7 [Amphibalanus amphitrite]